MLVVGDFFTLFPQKGFQLKTVSAERVRSQKLIDKDSAAIVTSGFAGWCYPVKTCAKSENVIIDIENEIPPEREGFLY